VLSWQRPVCKLAALICSLISAAPCLSQVAGTISLDSDYRLRGYSISGGKPAASASLSYDDPSGLYASGTAIGSLNYENRPDLLGALASVGYARRITTQISLDAGVSRTQYFNDASAPSGNAHYTEFYGGFIFHGISAHAFVSPDYLRHNYSVAYGEIDVLLKSFRSWNINGHIGVLGYLSSPREIKLGTQYDWRLGLSRRLGHFDLHAAITGGGPGSDYYRGRTHSKSAVVGGVSWSF
jgi:uncharacterized protein (TIGR02001 family)